MIVAEDTSLPRRQVDIGSTGSAIETERERDLTFERRA